MFIHFRILFIYIMNLFTQSNFEMVLKVNNRYTKLLIQYQYGIYYY